MPLNLTGTFLFKSVPISDVILTVQLKQLC